MMKRLAQISALVVAVSLSVVACGGGGGGGTTSNPSTSTASGTRTPLPTVVQDVEPPGVRLDMRAKNYFPSGDGDTWTYNLVQNGNVNTGVVSRSVSVADANHFFVSETSAFYSNSSSRYSRSSNGHVLGADVVLGSSAPAIAKQIVGSYVEYQEPFFPLGAERKLIRQGDWGADLDSDGITESFRLEYSQKLKGFEQTDTPLGRIEAARFQSVFTFTIVPSNADYSAATSIVKEETWWAAGVGLVRVTRDFLAPNGTTSTYTLELTGGSVGGKNIQDNWGLDGSVIKIALPHTSLIYDKTRNRYLATIPGNVATNGNRVAMIDAATGAVTFTRALGSEPSVLALSSAGDFLYVGLRGSGEVVKLRASDMAEQWRTRLHSDSFYGQATAESLSVDPTNSDVVAASMQWSGVSPRHAGVALLRSGVLQPKTTQGHTGSNLIVFDGSGQTLYGYNNETTEFGLRRISVLSDGLSEVQVVSTNAGFGSVGLRWSADGLWVGASKYKASDLSLTGTVGGSVAQCSPLNNAGKVVCLDTDFSATSKRLVVADASTFVVGSYLTYRDSFSISANLLVPGPANQVALRLDDTYFPSFHFASIWLFTSPALN